MTMPRTGAIAASAPRVCVEPLAPYLDRFAASLAGDGYASQTVRTKCALVADFNYWLNRHRWSLASLATPRIYQFHRLRLDSTRHSHPTIVQPFMSTYAT